MADDAEPGATGDTNDYRAIGHVVGVHGLQGTLKVVQLSDFDERFDALTTVFFLRDAEVVAQHTVKKVRWGARNLLISFRDLVTREAAEQLTGTDMCVPERESWGLPADTYYSSDLIGYRATGAGADDLGQLVAIRAGAQAILEFSGSRGELLVPFVKQWVGEIDTAAHTIEILNWRELSGGEELPPEPGDHDH
ncbi:16S rRNA processing protein RimM [candidate division KSB1 bacterium]|nr:16S rRNA processing protein RimM [candidate division KSB1 bacterium]